MDVAADAVAEKKAVTKGDSATTTVFNGHCSMETTGTTAGHTDTTFRSGTTARHTITAIKTTNEVATKHNMMGDSIHRDHKTVLPSITGHPHYQQQQQYQQGT